MPKISIRFVASTSVYLWATMACIEAAPEAVLQKRKKASKPALAAEARAIVEWAVSAPASKLRSRTTPNSEHPVMLFHGFGATKASMGFMHKRLREHGYTTYSSGQGLNLGAKDEDMFKILEKLDRIADEHEQRVSLIGHSLGGIVARDVAEARYTHEPMPNTPRKIGHITLPRLLPPLRPVSDPNQIKPLNIPTVSIYSTSDAIAGWSDCLLDGTANEQNIRIHSSHIGMARHHSALNVILTQLEKPANETRTPFEGAQPFYPPAHNWDPQARIIEYPVIDHAA
jgi:hypothetical protein